MSLLRLLLNLSLSKSAFTNSSASNFCRSSILSPTPIYFTGIPSSEWMATAIPPLAVPSSLVRMIPVISATLSKLSCLCKCILTGCTVQHNQCLTVSFRIFPVDHTVDFPKFCHKILFIMKSSCCIAEQYICMSCFGCLRSHRIQRLPDQILPVRK